MPIDWKRGENETILAYKYFIYFNTFGDNSVTLISRAQADCSGRRRDIGHSVRPRNNKTFLSGEQQHPGCPGRGNSNSSTTKLLIKKSQEYHQSDRAWKVFCQKNLHGLSFFFFFFTFLKMNLETCVDPSGAWMCTFELLPDEGFEI